MASGLHGDDRSCRCRFRLRSLSLWRGGRHPARAGRTRHPIEAGLHRFGLGHDDTERPPWSRPGIRSRHRSLPRRPGAFRIVRIRIIDGKGEAVPGCHLWVMLGTNEEFGRVSTGASGDVRLEVPEGSRPDFEVRVLKRPRVWGIHPLPLKARGDAEFTITLPR